MEVCPEFKAALESIRECKLSKKLKFEEIPGPAKMAPYTAAIAAETVAQDLGGRPMGTGRLVILYDPEQPAGWPTPWRCVALVSADTDPELAEDPCIGQVAWSWLSEALEDNRCQYAGLLGSVTTEMTATFGGLKLSSSLAHLQIQASWSPYSEDMGPHLLAWSDTLLLAAGDDPNENVTRISH